MKIEASIRKYLTISTTTGRLLLPISVTILALLWSVFVYQGTFKNLWITADQQGYSLYQKGNFTQAAQTFADPAFKASAFYKAGEFKKAAAIFATMSDANARYNLANAYLFMGQYPKAISFYALALKIKPDFLAAKENKAIAIARQAQLDKDKENDEGTGGALAADEIVYDNKNNRGQDSEEPATSSTDQYSHWLDRLQTGPKQFLEHKFSYQYRQSLNPIDTSQSPGQEEK